MLFVLPSNLDGVCGEVAQCWGAGCRDEGKGADTARILLSLVTMVRVLKHDHICVSKCPLRRRRGWSVSTENSWGPREAGKHPGKRVQ